MGFDPGRTVEVFGPRAYGSGYRIAPALVITAAHLLDGGDEADVTVRDRAGRSCAASSAWRGNAHDIAVLELVGAGVDRSAVPVRIGRLAAADGTVRPFDMVGWPRAAATREAEQVRRGPVHVRGELHLGERTDGGAGPLRLRPSEQYPALADGSWWEGMSGAAVFVDGLLVAVQARQPRAEITAYLAADQVAPARAGPGLAALEALLADHGVAVVEARDPRAALLHAYLSALDSQRAAPPGWFPERFHTAPGAVDALVQSPDLELQTGEGWRSLAALADIPRDVAVVVLEGEAGAGKTWALAARTRELAAQARADDAPAVLPAWCRLTDIEGAAGPGETLAAAIRATGADADALRAAASAGELPATWHLHIDGVDEASEVQRATLGRVVDRALAGDRELGRVVVATRPGELDLSAHPRLAKVRLDPFGSRKQAAFIRAWFAGRPDDADRVRVLTEHWRVRDSFRSPLVLTLACVALEGADGAVSLRNSADIFRAATRTLIENAHRISAVHGRSVAGRRERRRTVDALVALAARLFGPDGYQPSLAEREIEDVDTAVLDACLDTGVIALRDDGGIDFGNRSIATYLAAQAAALNDTWRDRLNEVWDTTAAAEIATFTPHALAAPLVEDADVAPASAWFEEAELRIAQGDPGFLLLHTLCAALTFLDPSDVAEQRSRAVRALRAHVLSEVDPRAADSLSTFSPDTLADLFAAVLETLEGVDRALELANVGHARGFQALERFLSGAGGRNDEAHVAGVAILEWLGRRGDSRGLALLTEQARSGHEDRRLLAALILAYWQADGAQELLASAIEAGPELSREVLLAAWLLSREGDAAAADLLLAARDSRDPVLALRALACSPDDQQEDLVDRLTALAKVRPSVVSIAAAVALHEDAPEVSVRELERMTEGDPSTLYGEDLDQLAVAAAYWLGLVERERGLARLVEQAAAGSHRGLMAATACSDIDAERSAQLLLALAVDDRVEVGIRAAAARVLEYLERPEAPEAIERVLASGPDADEAVRYLAPKGAMIEVMVDLGGIIEGVQTALAEPEAELDQIIESHRLIADVRPGDGVWRDATDSMLSDYGPDAGMAVGIFPEFDLDSEAGRRALAMAIPLFDVPGDRTFLMSQGTALAPDDDWLRLMARWSVGDFTDSIRTEDEAVGTRWARPVEILGEIGPGLLEWAAIAWQDPVWIIGRCLPLVLDHANAQMLVEMSHSVSRPVPPAMARGFNGIRPMPGLSDSRVRACVGRACLDGLASALATVDDPDAKLVRDEVRRRSEAVVCAHAQTEDTPSGQ